MIAVNLTVATTHHQVAAKQVQTLNKWETKIVLINLATATSDWQSCDGLLNNIHKNSIQCIIQEL